MCFGRPRRKGGKRCLSRAPGTDDEALVPTALHPVLEDFVGNHCILHLMLVAWSSDSLTFWSRLQAFIRGLKSIWLKKRSNESKTKAIKPKSRLFLENSSAIKSESAPRSLQECWQQQVPLGSPSNHWLWLPVPQSSDIQHSMAPACHRSWK